METITAKHLITKTKSPDTWFGVDYNMNIYRGCSHGCIYCDSRSECYGNTDFDTVKPKENALSILRDDLKGKRARGVIGTGAMSDPYNPLERTLCLTRGALDIINAFGFGADIATKSVLVTRDIDVLKEIRRHSPVIVKITVTTADDGLCAKVEPGAAVSSERFTAIKALSGSGIYCGVLMTPLLPFVNDTEDNVLGILSKAADTGAKFVYPAMGMTLRTGNREYYYAHLDALFPGIKRRYADTYGYSYQCMSPNADMLWRVFEERAQSLGLIYEMGDIIRAYKQGYEKEQLSFL